jgi:hypothetical protein
MNSQEEPEPIENDECHVWDLVLQDMKDRNELGHDKYGMYLQPHNGRRPLWDAYFEVLDLAVYIRQELYEKYGE